MKDRVEEELTGYTDSQHRASADLTPEILCVVVPFTTLKLTRAALRYSAVCSYLDVHLCLVDLQVVPFPCSLDQPPINKQYSERRLEELLRESGVTGEAALLYTRDWLEGFRRLLGPQSLVVIATSKRWWWPTREKKLARVLRNAGHQVVLLPVGR